MIFNAFETRIDEGEATVVLAEEFRRCQFHSFTLRLLHHCHRHLVPPPINHSVLTRSDFRGENASGNERFLTAIYDTDKIDLIASP